MSIKIPHNLPAVQTLLAENICVVTETSPDEQTVHPLRIALLNLMPKKIQTETQFARLLGGTPLHVELTLLHAQSHFSKNVSQEHLHSFYQTFEDVKTQSFDGLIITGAPVEHLAFEDVDYWQELSTIMEWSKTHVRSTLYICWGAQAGLYYHYGIQKHGVPEKMFGIFPHRVEKCSKLFEGFEGEFMVPQSRHTTVLQEEIERVPALSILSVSDKTGVYAVTAQNGKQIFITGHSEYDEDTLKTEYLRDLSKGKPIHIPENYFPNDDPNQAPVLSWRAPAKRLFSNWLHYFVSPNADCDD